MRTIRTAVGALAATCAVMTSVAHASAPTPLSPRSALERAAGQRDKGEKKETIRTLKEGVEAFPNHERLHHALALAYLADDNAFWALKVLRGYEQKHPPACNTRAFQAWIHVKQANFELAEEILDAPGCDIPLYAHARQLLLRAHLAAQKGEERKVRSLVEQARDTGRYYEEDKALLDALSTRYDPGHIPVLSWRVDLAAGWTSNGLAGSPKDPAGIGVDTSSSITQLDARLRVVIPASRSIRPVIEGQLRALELGAPTVAPLSYRQPSVRPGVMFGRTYPRLLLSYGFDAVHSAAGDQYENGPLWYSEGHRFDYEIEATETLFAFGGGGHRWYREAGRTRWEAEQGLAARFGLTDQLQWMAGGSVRQHFAENDAFDAYGGTALSQLGQRLPMNLEARVNVSISYDAYPSSRGFFPGSQGNIRTDVLFRIKPGLWSPSWSGIRAGVDWEYSRRGSTAANYAYTDNRILIHGVWVMDGERFSSDVIPTEGREPIPHAAVSAQLGDEEMRIRDLMRQDEAVKRGSSCLN